MAIGDYNKTVWINETPGGGIPAINATNLNNIENKIKELDSEIAIAARWADIMNDGIANLATDFLITYHDNMTLTVGAGVGYYQGYRIVFAGGDFTFTAPTSGTVIRSLVIPTPAHLTTGFQIYNVTCTAGMTKITSAEVSAVREQAKIKSRFI
ncbi:hypothetical protein [Acetivibrio cellulolyticus]|uniref:hypothetical protein n=1 Tax=Acetivibrio cellulolyticus TaxID=35830 RepID=UPI0001E2C28D|nr:hypothetical protein [Acetivibrio cellulolyticus]